MRTTKQLRLAQKAGEYARQHVQEMARCGLGLMVDAEDLNGGCALASYIVWRVLQGLGVESQLVLGSYEGLGGHCWVEGAGKIVDATATQFDLPGPVYITNVDNPDYLGNRDADHRKLRDAEAVEQLAHAWWPEQSPLCGPEERQEISEAINVIAATLSS